MDDNHQLLTERHKGQQGERELMLYGYNMNGLDNFDIASMVKWKSDNPAHPQGMIHHPNKKLKKSIRKSFTLKKAIIITIILIKVLPCLNKY